MGKNLVAKTVLILGLTALAAWTLYPPSKTLKPGIDLAGGTSLIYAIDTTGLHGEETRDMAQRMIEVLRRRIDPGNMQNLIWRPQGNTRFEIQMPLASQATRLRRQQYEEALQALLAKNVNPASVLRALQEPAEQRDAALKTFAQGDPNHLTMLQNMVSIYDQRKAAQNKRDGFDKTLEQIKSKLSAAGVDMNSVEASRRVWVKQTDDQLAKTLKDFLGTKNEGQLATLTEYVSTLKQKAQIEDELTKEDGLNEQYDQARRKLDRLSLTLDQINYLLEAKPAQRATLIEERKAEFPDRAAAIDRVVAAYDAYRPYQGQLDDPEDLKRMLKGAGILEFRILPTVGRTELTQNEINRYVETLKEKGPSAASDNNYKWCEIENKDEWDVPDSIVAPFGNKTFVLASNKPDETMLHSATGRSWKLEKAMPSTDSSGRRAIGFQLDDRGAQLFYNITSKNVGRPLCILLDDLAISAPNINQAIAKSGIIMGTFSATQVNDMVNKLNAGSLPARLIEQPISERSIGPSIGAENRDQGIISGFVGLALVIIGMLIYYLIGGAIADVALLLNVLFLLAIMAGLRATFTLPGIAGVILTIGMAVDANVLIFERMREEQQRGAGIATAIKAGYEKAFSAIFDSNLTTVLTAAILYYVASEDIKGFAITLILGLSASMFTALFVTRVIFDWLVTKRILKNQLIMLHLVRGWNVNWMNLRKYFFAFSAVLTIGGLIVFFSRGKDKYDIEFTGGTAVQVNFKPDVRLTRQDVEDRIVQVGREIGNSALQAANIYSVGQPIAEAPNGEKIYSQYEINTTATNRTETEITFTEGGSHSADSVASAIKAAPAFNLLPNLAVAPEGQKANSFLVTTGQLNPSIVKKALTDTFSSSIQIEEPRIDQVVNNAVQKAFANDLEVQRNLGPTLVSADKITDESIDAHPDLASYVGGLMLEYKLQDPASIQQIDRRLKDLHFKPEAAQLTWDSTYTLLGPNASAVTDPNKPVESFTYVSVLPETGLREFSEDEWTRFVTNEEHKVTMAASLQSSLPRVTQIDPSIGSEQKTRALIAIILSLIAIAAYLWFRFGDLRYGVAGILTLAHDCAATLGVVSVCTWLAATPFGQALLIGDFKINGTMVAAFLTLLGYSINDTIVVFDRIRENRHKAQLTAQTITNSINQTMSRTLLTSICTLLVVFVMYVFGGSGLRGFNFAILFGIFIGTYSSIAISSPLLLVGLKSNKQS
jgi:SecD/SecF fusion protein